MTDLADVVINLKPNGISEAVINGEDLSDSVVGLNVQVRPGQPPIITLHRQTGCVAIEGPGIVQVPVEGVGEQDVVQRWLGMIDPFALEQEVLSRAVLDGGVMITALEVLKEWANDLH